MFPVHDWKMTNGSFDDLLLTLEHCTAIIITILVLWKREF